ncbi:MAG: type II toxin-antitoxin system prevent-host-death family antitoxin [Bacteroidota bacterium]
MALIKPISDLRNKSHELSALARDSDEPIFITKNGEGDMVIMSIAYYRKLQYRLELLGRLSVAEAQRNSGDSGRPSKHILQELREKLHESAKAI